jgi:hypothetical protein
MRAAAAILKQEGLAEIATRRTSKDSSDLRQAQRPKKRQAG